MKAKKETYPEIKLIYSNQKKLKVRNIGCKRAELKEDIYRGVFM